MLDILTIRWLLKFVCTIFMCTKALMKATKLKKQNKWNEYKPIVDEVIRNDMQRLMDDAKIKFVVNGLENVPKDEPVIYTPNHTGAFDFPTILLTPPNPPAFMAKRELARVPFAKPWFNVMDCVFVERDNKESARRSLNRAIDLVKNGRSLAIFPEGTRSKNGELGEFKGGAMKIAMETGAKIVPMVIDGTRDRYETNGKLTPGTVYVTFLPPIETKGLSKEEFFKMPGQLRSLISNERAKQRAERKKENVIEAVI